MMYLVITKQQFFRQKFESLLKLRTRGRTSGRCRISSWWCRRPDGGRHVRCRSRSRSAWSSVSGRSSSLAAGAFARAAAGAASALLVACVVDDAALIPEKEVTGHRCTVIFKFFWVGDWMGVVRKFRKEFSIFVFYCIFMVQIFKVFWRGTWGAPSSPHLPPPPVCTYVTFGDQLKPVNIPKPKFRWNLDRNQKFPITRYVSFKKCWSILIAFIYLSMWVWIPGKVIWNDLSLQIFFQKWLQMIFVCSIWRLLDQIKLLLYINKTWVGFKYLWSRTLLPRK